MHWLSFLGGVATAFGLMLLAVVFDPGEPAWVDPPEKIGVPGCPKLKRPLKPKRVRRC